jgi:Animal haem peroxidase
MTKHDNRTPLTSDVTRRGFLASVAAGAAATALNPLESVAQHLEGHGVAARSDRFSRMFDLPSFAEPTPRIQAALMELGAPGGLMDAMDPLHEGPIRLITNPELSPNNRDNPAATAGLTFLGQFLDHDITFDATSRLGEPTQPERARNTRTPAFDLDSVYGGGYVLNPELYDPADHAKFKVEHGGLFEDLPRGTDGRAIIADPRNDENLMISGLQVAFLRFHNRVVDKLRDDGDDRRLAAAHLAEGGFTLHEREEDDRRRAVFQEARRVVTWHYQWIIVNEFLPQIIGGSLVNDILSRGPRFHTPQRGPRSMPVEFQAAAYRFGHSLVRPSYRANLAGDGGRPFFGFIFDPAGESQVDPVDLRGGARAPRRFIGWQTFFDFGGDQSANVRPPKIIDTKISSPLFNLPLGAIASGDRPTALPQRNLLRHLTWSLPSGQAIARAMGVPAVGPGELRELASFGVGFEWNTPLWYYVLKEAELSGGARLVGVGARIVGEVFLGLLMLDRDSYLWRNRNWRPTLPSRARGTFGMVDLLTFAGVDPASRRQ